MGHTLKRVAVSFAVLSVISANFLPLAAEAKTIQKHKAKRKVYHISISAIPGKDEKNFDNPTSRCLTKEMVALNAKAAAQMEKDIAKVTDHPAAIEKYKSMLDIVWSAMTEPYCGYGSRGISAVKKSFIKSIDRIRAEFLADLKKPEPVVTQPAAN